MILSYLIPECVAYRDAQIALYEIERDIERRQNSKHNVDRSILPRLTEKRARLAVDIAPLKAAAEAAERAALARLLAPTPAMKAAVYVPAPGKDPLDIPDFLRRTKVK